MNTTGKFLVVIAAMAALFSLNTHAAEPKEIIGSYLNVQKALAKDDLAAAKKAAKELESAATDESAKELKTAAGKVAVAGDIQSARKEFGPLSQEAIAFAKKNSRALEQDLYVAYCPMALKGGADWLQDSDKIANPYFGASMLTCGGVKETLKGK